MVVTEALDFPGAVTQGFDLPDARLMIASALETRSSRIRRPAQKLRWRASQKLIIGSLEKSAITRDSADALIQGRFLRSNLPEPPQGAATSEIWALLVNCCLSSSPFEPDSSERSAIQNRPD